MYRFPYFFRVLYVLITCFSLILGISSSAYSDDTVSVQKLGVLPFSPTEISNDEALLIAAAVRRAFPERIQCITTNTIMNALEDADCEDSDEWDDFNCIVSAGKEMGADFILGGTIKKENEQFIISAILYNISEKTEEAWSDEYIIQGSTEDVYNLLPRKIAEDIDKILSVKYERESVKIEVTSVIEDTTPANTEVIQKESTVPVKEEPVDYGGVSGVTFGIGGYVALAETQRDQSPGGFMISAIYPTSEKTQMRIKTGVPLFRNQSVAEHVDIKTPDPYISIEHDWLWRFFSISTGLAYLSMQGLSKSNYWYYNCEQEDYYFDDYCEDYYKVKTKEKYDNHNAFNMVLSLRAGLPNRGFYGRISWPLAFNIGNNDAHQFFIEYSVFGAFGWGKNKFGFGVMGMNKYREPDPETIETIDSVSVEEKEFVENLYRIDNETNDFYLLLPCMKYSRLVGDRVVLNFTLEIGGLILPRLIFSNLIDFEDEPHYEYDYLNDDDSDSDNIDWWKPSIGLNIIYSLKPLKGPHEFNGSF